MVRRGVLCLLLATVCTAAFQTPPRSAGHPGVLGGSRPHIVQERAPVRFRLPCHAAQRVGFGQYESKTYEQVYETDPLYCKLVLSQTFTEDTPQFAFQQWLSSRPDTTPAEEAATTKSFWGGLFGRPGRAAAEKKASRAQSIQPWTGLYDSRGRPQYGPIRRRKQYYNLQGGRVHDAAVHAAVSRKRGGEPVYLFHYTDKETAKEVVRTGRLQASSDDCVLYFTTLPPWAEDGGAKLRRTMPRCGNKQCQAYVRYRIDSMPSSRQLMQLSVSDDREVYLISGDQVDINSAGALVWWQGD